MEGKVIKYFEDKGYGFIRTGKIENIFFHISDVLEEVDRVPLNKMVKFEVEENIDGKTRAINITFKRKERPPPPKPYEGETRDLSENEISDCLEEIKSWKLEAKLEDMEKYFFHVPELNLILKGQASYIIGRKGTGKSALVKYLSQSAPPNTRVKQLSFKNFPFGMLYHEKNDSYTRPNQFITIWKFIIYSFACSMLAESDRFDPLIAKHIRKAFPPAESDNLGTLIRQWSISDISLIFKGTGLSLKGFKKKEFSLQEKVDNLEKFLIKNLNQEKYFLLFDELDEDYKNIQETFFESNYLDLLTSLFKAVQDINGTFALKGKNLFPIVLLRDDIFDLVKDADKTKWKDLSLKLEWNREEIKNLIIYRLNKVFGSDRDNFEHNWYSLFDKHQIPFSSGKKHLPSFDYITRSTQGRPRDYIQYLKSCAEIQISKGGGIITNEVVKDADKDYSSYLKSELVDEIHSILPDIDAIFRLLGHIRKWIFSREEFHAAHADQISSGNLTTKDPDLILQILYNFSVIGNVTASQKHIYRHISPNATLNYKEKIVVHRGLMKALQIF